MTQIGVLLFYVLPICLETGSCCLIGIPLAALYAVITKRLFYQKRSFLWGMFQVFLAIILGIFLLYDLSVLGMEYVERRRWWPLLSILLLGILQFGRRKKITGQVPGQEGLQSLWFKAFCIGMIFVLCLQIPNFRMEECWTLKGVNTMKVFSSSFLIYFMNIPFFLGLGREYGTKKENCVRQLGVWFFFYLTFIVMSGVFHYKILEQMRVPFLALGRSAVSMGKQPVRIEIPTVWILWAGMFFGLWECVNVIYGWLGREKNEKNTVVL